MTPTPFWPTPTPLPPATPPVPIEFNFEIGQDWAYSSVQLWNTLSSGGDLITGIQVGIIAIVVFAGLLRIISRFREL